MKKNLPPGATSNYSGFFSAAPILPAGSPVVLLQAHDQNARMRFFYSFSEAFLLRVSILTSGRRVGVGSRVLVGLFVA